MVNIKNLFKQQENPLPTPIFHENKFVIDFNKKSVWSKVSIFQINAKYWTTLISFLRNYQHKPTSYEILKIIQNLDPGKAHGHDIISIPLLKVCGLSVCKPLELIFKSCIGNELILQNGKKQIFFQKIKNDKQLLRNCRPVLRDWLITKCLNFS